VPYVETNDVSGVIIKASDAFWSTGGVVVVVAVGDDMFCKIFFFVFLLSMLVDFFFVYRPLLVFLFLFVLCFMRKNQI
jgi:hypothetical protein